MVLAVGQDGCGRVGHQVDQDLGTADADVDGLRGPPSRADGKQLVGAGRRHKVAGRRRDGQLRGRCCERARHLRAGQRLLGCYTPDPVWTSCCRWCCTNTHLALVKVGGVRDAAVAVKDDARDGAGGSARPGEGHGEFGAIPGV